MNEHKEWFDLAIRVAENSLDPARKVGAVLVPKYMGKRRFIVGYNRAAWPNEMEFDFSRPDKNDFMIHAELDVLLFAGAREAAGGTLYVTSQPCLECAKHIVACNVARVLWLDATDRQGSKWVKSWEKAEALFSENNMAWAGFERTKNDYVLRRERSKND